MSGFKKFLSSAAIVKVDVLLGIIFHNRQTNDYMTSPVSIPLSISLEFARYLRLPFIIVQI